MDTSELLNRALKFEFLTAEEGLFLFKNANTSELMYTANELRKKQVRIIKSPGLSIAM